MAYMKKNVNVFLLAVIILIVVALAGLTSYYQYTYRGLSSSYEDKLSELNRILEELNLERGKLNQTSYALTIKTEREEALGEQFTEVKGEKEKLATDLSATEDDLERISLLLQSTQNSLQGLQYDYNVIQEQNADLQQSVDYYKEKAADYKKLYDACAGTT